MINNYNGTILSERRALLKHINQANLIQLLTRLTFH